MRCPTLCHASVDAASGDCGRTDLTADRGRRYESSGQPCPQTGEASMPRERRIVPNCLRRSHMARGDRTSRGPPASRLVTSARVRAETAVPRRPQPSRGSVKAKISRFGSPYTGAVPGRPPSSKSRVWCSTRSSWTAAWFLSANSEMATAIRTSFGRRGVQ